MMTKRLMVTLAAVFALAILARPIVRAHEGHEHKTMGTVKSIQDDHLEVEDKDGKVTMFMVTDETKILRGKAAAPLAEVTVGERVVVTAAMEEKAGAAGATAEHGAGHGSGHDAMMTAKEIRLGSAEAKTPRQ